MTDIYKKTVNKKVIDAISSDVVGLNAFWTLRENVSNMIMGTQSNKEEIMESIRTSVNVITNSALNSRFFSLQAGCYGTLSFKSNPEMHCNKKEDLDEHPKSS
jgi:hypothetical protein